jgi:hypothetical protein
MANQTQKWASWTIKAVPVHVREKAVRYAKMDDVSMAEWLARAVETEANRQDGNEVIPPVKEPATLESAMAAIDRGFKVAGMLQALASASSAGLKVSPAAVNDTVRVMRSQVREAGGLPLLKGRQTSGKNGQTINAHQEIVVCPNGASVSQSDWPAIE